MKNIVYLLTILSFAYSQCEEYNDASQCDINSSCYWVSDIEYYNCTQFNSSSACSQYSDYGCSWEFSWGGWMNHGSSCVGGGFQIDNGYCEETIMPECSEEYEFECNDGSCIDIGRLCNNIDDCADGSDEVDCEECSEEYEFECNDGSCIDIGRLCNNIDDCADGSDEVDCEDCSELEEVECDQDSMCDWIEDIDYVSCSDLTASECSQYFDYGCVLDSDCAQWGSWYTWLCYDYGPSYCTGGSYQLDNSYCEETEYQLGDVNQDFFINVLDVIVIVDFVISAEYNVLADMNFNNIVNIQDIILLVNYILNQ